MGAFLLCGCDQGQQLDAPQGLGVPTQPVKLLASNVGMNQPLPANGQIKLQFDRLLLPLSLTRQTFSLQDIAANTAYTPPVSYDPVARIVTIQPLTDGPQALTPQQAYQLVIETPKNAADRNGLRAIDGALLEESSRIIPFSATDPDPSPPAPVVIDFCRDIDPIFEQSCGSLVCHGTATSAAAGLLLVPGSNVAATAIGRVAQGANTGPRSQPAAPSLLFGEDMPVVDPGGDPANSWMIYKLLMAVPGEAPDAGDGTAEVGTDSSVADAGSFDAAEGGASEAGASEAGASEAGASEAGASEAGAIAVPPPPPVDVSHVHAPLAWTDISASERATLREHIQGREMPYVTTIPSLTGTGDLTLEELERVSLWIAQGAKTSPNCQH